MDFGRAQIRTQIDASFSPFGHPSQVRTKVLVCKSALTCVDLQFSPFRQGLFKNENYTFVIQNILKTVILED